MSAASLAGGRIICGLLNPQFITPATIHRVCRGPRGTKMKEVFTRWADAEKGLDQEALLRLLDGVATPLGGVRRISFASKASAFISQF